MVNVHEKYGPRALIACSLKTRKPDLKDGFLLRSHAVVDEIGWLIDSNHRRE